MAVNIDGNYLNNLKQNNGGVDSEKAKGLGGLLSGIANIAGLFSDKNAKVEIEEFDPYSKKLYSKKKKRVLKEEEEE